MISIAKGGEVFSAMIWVSVRLAFYAPLPLGFAINLPCTTFFLGKTIQVIGLCAALMHKDNDRRDIDRRKKYVSQMQDVVKDRKKMPRANAKWPTALIIVPVSVVQNWGRELDTVRTQTASDIPGCRLNGLTCPITIVGIF